ncbi:MAG: hypothetical protein R1F52_04195 [Candidatus Nitrosoabyssus spongiisocia]|nr:MAG: hypothetical protein R1F52_04195 [Nitrosopumilaceae archaeon AB1(1)]
MATYHIKKQSYDGYCIGKCVEEPNIMLHAKSDEELLKKFARVIPAYKQGIKKIKITRTRLPKEPKIEVLKLETN